MIVILNAQATLEKTKLNPASIDEICVGTDMCSNLFVGSLAYISWDELVKEPAIHPHLYMSLVLLRWRLESPTASQSLPSIGFAPPGLWLLGISRTAFMQGRYRSV
jgi:hypothetical protein